MFEIGDKVMLNTDIEDIEKKLKDYSVGSQIIRELLAGVVFTVRNITDGNEVKLTNSGVSHVKPQWIRHATEKIETEEL